MSNVQISGSSAGRIGQQILVLVRGLGLVLAVSLTLASGVAWAVVTRVVATHDDAIS